MEDCVNLNIENENVALTPEMLIDRKLCFPERHIGGPDPSEWTNSTFIKKFGVPDRQITENKILSVDLRFSNQKEIMNKPQLPRGDEIPRGGSRSSWEGNLLESRDYLIV